MVGEKTDSINLIAHSDPDEVLDQEQNDLTQYGMGRYSGQFAQAYQPSLMKVSKVELRAFSKGSPGGVTASIRSQLQGGDLRSASVPGSEFSPYGKWIEFDFQDLPVSPGQTYYIVWTPIEPSNEGNICYWQFGVNNPYKKGGAWVNLGSGWEHLDDYEDWHGIDFGFRTYGIDEPPDIPTIDGPVNGLPGVD